MDDNVIVLVDWPSFQCKLKYLNYWMGWNFVYLNFYGPQMMKPTDFMRLIVSLFVFLGETTELFSSQLNLPN